LYNLAWIFLFLAVKNPTIGRDCTGLISSLQDCHIRMRG
jgi:hypothetical protein